MMRCTEEQFIPEDDSPSIHSDADGLSRFVGLVAPLVERGRTWRDIGEDIIIPAQHCGAFQRDELDELSRIFSIILRQIGNAILSALADYLSTPDPQNILAEFVDSMQGLTDAIVDAGEYTLIDAFRLGLLKELRDERF